MNSPPPYFARIREEAARRWAHLESDPDLAGPWHQLFRQVQSPRHVLSELLQNADDSGATKVEVLIDDDEFAFCHDGEDFSEDHFSSLCRFGFSNKRALHTIGFRGIGFKSTFSLGDQVHVSTRTLSVAFDRRRFTEPHWVDRVHPIGLGTSVRVMIKDSDRRRELEKNLQEWIAHSVSLLFFRNIRSLTIASHRIDFVHHEPGPISKSIRFRDGKNDGEELLLIQSEPEGFPQEALDEIRQERMLDMEGALDFPPCKVEIVLGAEGRLHVVLPTGVLTRLPFACNAPFIQDPARYKIKDPSISPTNRWLLKRIGRLAADAIQEWVGNAALSAEVRAMAYRLVPDKHKESNELDEVVETIIASAFLEVLANRPVVLTSRGEVVQAGLAIRIPSPLHNVWNDDQLEMVLHPEIRPFLSGCVAKEHADLLVKHAWAVELSKARILRSLAQNHPAKPRDWASLTILWSFLAEDIYSWRYGTDVLSLNIVPVSGDNLLHPTNAVLRIGEAKYLKADEDWLFLSPYVQVIDTSWVRYLEDQRSIQKSGYLEMLLSLIGFGSISDGTAILRQVSSRFFARTEIQDGEYYRLAQIGAKLSATVDCEFYYISQSCRALPIANKPIAMFKTEFIDLVPGEILENQTISAGYTMQFTSCTKIEWETWISSGKAGLQLFVPMEMLERQIASRAGLEQVMKSKGYRGLFEYPFNSSLFSVVDWDFPKGLWDYWKLAAVSDPSIWVRLLWLLATIQPGYWNTSLSARGYQKQLRNKPNRAIPHCEAPASWILQLRELPCVPDTFGRPCIPRDLLLRNPVTDNFRASEAFVDAHMDTESFRPVLDALGVSGVPPSSDRYLACLRALSQAISPPLAEVEKWYRCLDAMISEGSTSEMEKIRSALFNERLILSNDGVWSGPPWIFIDANDIDAPYAPLIKRSIKDLALWHRIGIPDRPSLEFVFSWLESLSDNEALQEVEVRRIRALISRHGRVIFDRTAHALNLINEWVPASSLRYAITGSNSVPYSHLYDSIKRQTADLRDLHQDEEGAVPTFGLTSLGKAIENRLLFPSQVGTKLSWMSAIGGCLSRIKLEDAVSQTTTRELGKRICRTCLQRVETLRIMPYLNNTPAGTARQLDVLWQGDAVILEKTELARMAKILPRELSRPFASQDISDALAYAFERHDDEICAYMESNFSLDPVEILNVKEMLGVQDGVLEIAPKMDRSSIPETRLHADSNPASDPHLENASQESVSPANDMGLLALAIAPGPSQAQAASEGAPKERVERVPHIPLMERFAKAQGFTMSAGDDFAHANGSRIDRSMEGSFPWERKNPNGEIVCRYLSIEHCLQAKPLELPADVWSLIEGRQDVYSLILLDLDEKPIEYPGRFLLALRDSGQLRFFPAAYRIALTPHDGPQ